MYFVVVETVLQVRVLLDTSVRWSGGTGRVSTSRLNQLLNWSARIYPTSLFNGKCLVMVDRVRGRRHVCYVAACGRLLPENIIACLSSPSVTGMSSAAHGRVFLCTLLCPNCIPAEDKSSKKSANQDTDNDVSIIVHCQQYDEISYSELQYIQESCCKLLLGVRLA
jgi:hypothetical protein